jgi:hypothetical protein
LASSFLFLGVEGASLETRKSAIDRSIPSKKAGGLLLFSCVHCREVLTHQKDYSLAAAMSSYGNPSAPPYRGQSQGQGWQQQQQQQQQTPSYGQTGGSYNYGDSAPSSYGQQQTNYGQPPPASSYGQQPSAYSSYGQTYPAYGQTPYGQPTSIRSHFPPGTDPEIVRVFEQADTDRSGTIEAKELGKILSADYGDFSPRTVRLMLHLYADNKTDTTRIGTFFLFLLLLHHLFTHPASCSLQILPN